MEITLELPPGHQWDTPLPPWVLDLVAWALDYNMDVRLLVAKE